MPRSIEFANLSVRAPSGRPILEEISLVVTPGEAVAFIGRSGAGKTTALRAVNGMVRADGGSVRIDGVDLPSLDLVAHRRRTGYVIQGSGLFPHRSVYQNVATVPRL